MTLAVVCGTLLVGIICLILTFGVIGSIAAVGSSAPVLPKTGVLKMDMSKITIAEQSQEANPFASITGEAGLTIGIWDAVQAINIAAADPAVQYIYLKTDGTVSSITAIQEIRESLENFRVAGGKPVVSYIESPSTASYYLSSVADKIYMTAHPGASTMVTGVSSQMIFLGDLLDKLGVNVQLIRHGKYKSAGEMYTRGSSSPENREQYQRLVDSMWEGIAAQIAESRGKSVEEVNAAIDELKLNLPEDFLQNGFVDELLTREGLENKLATLAVVDEFKDVKMMDFADYVSVKVTPGRAKQQIAVIYAEGEIVDGNASAEVAGDRFASIIRKVKADSTVKAVVLRVNSPGGSVLASEKIKVELDALKETKPVIASYGDYAASGGYWISNNCDKIYSNAATLTGSIGVFGMVPDVSKTLKNVAHVGVETVSSNKHGDMYSLTRPFDSAEYAYMFRSIEDIYDRFTSIVSEGRGIPVETVDAIGQGRVWTGADALGIHLVDEIGTLEDAIRYAAVVGGDPDIDNWNVKGYPKPQGQMEMILSSFGLSDSEDVLAKTYKAIKEPRILARTDTRIQIR